MRRSTGSRSAGGCRQEGSRGFSVSRDRFLWVSRSAMGGSVIEGSLGLFTPRSRLVERCAAVSTNSPTCRPGQCRRQFRYDGNQNLLGFGEELRHIVGITELARLAEQGEGFPCAEHQIIRDGCLIVDPHRPPPPSTLGTLERSSHMPCQRRVIYCNIKRKLKGCAVTVDGSRTRPVMADRVAAIPIDRRLAHRIEDAAPRRCQLGHFDHGAWVALVQKIDEWPAWGFAPLVDRPAVHNRPIEQFVIVLRPARPVLQALMPSGEKVAIHAGVVSRCWINSSWTSPELASAMVRWMS